MKIEKVTLEGSRVRLEPLEERHRAGLAEAIRDGELWKLVVTRVPHPDDLDGFYEEVAREWAAGRELAFATVDRATGTLVGSTRFRNAEVKHLRVEIGFTFVRKSMQRTFVNTEAKYLMLRHAFETWRVNRVELITDLLNTRSQEAIARIGARREGVLRSHMVRRDGSLRDTVVFSVIAPEWPAVKGRLEEKLSGTGS